ncbi:UvrD-helicase domain-containing protein [Amycolatopsis thermoflava]|uniref:UvrD-helicase domain-containing protein n=1 Tax=Amycolatopsis thermoflava TaxID=84480 RepID=UPI003658298E
MTDLQRQAAASQQSNLLVVAPPGCGKTELLALRAQELIPGLRPNQRILALTFTNRAKTNLSNRLRDFLGRNQFRRYVAVRNFHGHAAEIVRAHGPTIGIDRNDLKFPGRKTIKDAFKPYSVTSDAARAAEELLAKIKLQPLTDDEVAAEIDKAGDQLAKRIEKDRIAANQLHYNDLLRYAQLLLRVDAVENLYQQHYGAVLVDEFQDMSLQQLEVAVRSAKASRTFVGDPLQGIYSWAGADPKQVESFLRQLCGDPLQLDVSYRSSPAVLGMVNALSAEMGAAPLRAHDPARWPNGGVACALTYPSREDEAQSVVLGSKLICDLDPTASVGVITRSGWRRAEIDKAFERHSVPCRRWDLAVDEPSVLDLLHRFMRTLPAKTSITDARDKILSLIEPTDVDTVDQVADAFDQLGGESGDLHTTLGRMTVVDSLAPVGPGIHLLNAHTGKGQQFDWVLVPGLEERHIPDRRSTSVDQLAEECRVLLVMLSRARKGVIVTRSTTSTDRYGRIWPSNESRWWPPLAQLSINDSREAWNNVRNFYAS